ncbi:coniferyl-alcohol dehydrogenase [Phenylobacterium sp. LjRoot219]|uniref:coniferyl-alcohol dehydrogenase n=1 Tax=Phenylobacterium sp. LjRoot219 TaxID=3342283 RepID=UPI003ECC4430
MSISYKNKRVVITGCFSGMGEATARLLLSLGAEVHGLDYKPSSLDLASFTNTDLRDPASIDAAVAGLKGEFDVLFNCAGVPSTFAPIDVFKVNYIGPRRLTDQLAPRIKAGGAIACIASTAGFGWARRIPLLQELIAKPSYAEAVAWCEEQLKANADAYTLSKETIIVWTQMSAASLIKRGVRMNCILPGPTSTPFMEQQSTITPDAAIDAFTQPINRRSSPEEQAWPLVFLGSDAASYVNGVALPVDGGFIGGVATGEIDLAKLFGANPKASGQ